MEINYRQVGRRIKTRRIELGMSQAVLAEICHISNVYISSVERGVSIPSLSVFLRITQALETTPDYFFTETPFSSTEYINDDIAHKLKKCNAQSLSLINALIDAVLSQQDSAG